MRQYRSLITVTAILGIRIYRNAIDRVQPDMDLGNRFQRIRRRTIPVYHFWVTCTACSWRVIALLVMFLKAFSSKIRNYNPVSVELISTYWHFVDLLWIYLFVFFLFTL